MKRRKSEKDVEWAGKAIPFAVLVIVEKCCEVMQNLRKSCNERVAEQVKLNVIFVSWDVFHFSLVKNEGP
jgi:hypothetical protein